MRTLSSALSTLTIPSKGVTEIMVRYTDPYDAERMSPWVTLTVHPTNSRTAPSTLKPGVRPVGAAVCRDLIE